MDDQGDLTEYYSNSLYEDCCPRCYEEDCVCAAEYTLLPQTKKRIYKSATLERRTDIKEEGTMKIKAVRYERILNIGNYENERVACEVEVEAGDEADAAFVKAKSFVNEQLGIDGEDLTPDELEKLKRRVAVAERKVRR